MSIRRAKIVCTLGPASGSAEMLEKLIKAGMDCARLNFSHGTHEDHEKTAKLVRAASQKLRKPVAILADLSGPKMRIGRFPKGAIELEAGQPFVFSIEDIPGDEKQVSVSYKRLTKDTKPGDTILLDDGLLRMKVDRCTDTEVFTTVIVGGPLSDRKGLNLPGVDLSTPAVTEKDKKDLAFAVDVIGVDYAALSFVRHADDVREAKALAKGTPLIAKIEKPEALEHLEEIIDASDGIMVARGDLGVEVGPEKVPLQQKRIIRETNKRGKVVITATQMLDSMIRNPYPTRAEAADVANAVMDGTDAVMLSGETAAGKYPEEAVKMMSSIVTEIESEWLEELSRKVRDIKFEAMADWEFAEATARAAAGLSTHLDLKAIVAFTRTGQSANLLSEHRPRAPIIAITHDPHVAQQAALRWGVLPRVEVPAEDLSEYERIASAVIAREGYVEKGDSYMMLFGWPVSGRTNSLRLLHKQ